MKILQNIKKIISKLFSFSPVKLKSPLTPALSPNGRGRSAFTLAEVLITLGVIGILAEMTIPTVISNVKTQERKAMAKKEYSILSQAYTTILADNGGNFAGVCADRNRFVDKFAEQLRFEKKCYAGSAHVGECFPHPLFQYSGSQDTGSYGGLDGSLMLADGSSLWLTLWNPNCDKSISITGTSETFDNYCGWIAFDINGFKGPNTWGKDVFSIAVLSNKLFPDNNINGVSNVHYHNNYVYKILNGIEY